MGMGTGALAVIGGTVVIIGFLTLSTCALIAVQGYNPFQRRASKPSPAFCRPFLSVRFIAPATAGWHWRPPSLAGATRRIGAMRINEEIDATEVDGHPTITIWRPPGSWPGVRGDPQLYTVAVLMSFLATRFGTTIVTASRAVSTTTTSSASFSPPTCRLWSFRSGTVHGGRRRTVHTYYGFTATGRAGRRRRGGGPGGATSVTATVYSSLLTITLAVYGNPATSTCRVTPVSTQRNSVRRERIDPIWWAPVMVWW